MSQKSSPSQTDNPKGLISDNLPEYIDLEAAVNIYKERIRNLEKFRDLFFEAKEALIEKEAEERALMNEVHSSEDQITYQKLKEFKEKAQNNVNKIKELEDALKTLEFSDERHKDLIDEQLSEISTLSRSIQESNDCIAVLESELDTLVQTNTKLQDELALYQESDDDEPIDVDAELSNLSESVDDSELADEGEEHDRAHKYLRKIKSLEKGFVGKSAQIRELFHFELLTS